jgi:hypothetical protein
MSAMFREQILQRCLQIPDGRVLLRTTPPNQRSVPLVISAHSH